MASEEKPVLLAEAAQQVQVLCASPLASFVSQGSRGELKAAAALITELQAGIAPKISANASGFLTKVWGRLQWFCSYSYIKAGKSQETLRGPKAL
eukprot:11207310-Lingulodinium_polyedra.AAC.1